jgi:glycosyltransferase involved in cell wall biosynthesis
MNGGIEKQIYELIKHLTQKNIYVKYLTTFDEVDKKISSNNGFDGLEIINVKCKRIKIPNFYPKVPVFSPISVKKAFEKDCKNADIVHSFNEFFSSFIASVKNNGQAHVHSQQNIIYADEVFFPYKMFFNFLQTYALSRYYKRCDLIAPISNFLKTQLMEYHNINEHKLAVVPNGVDCSLFKPSSKKRKELREKENLDEKIFVFSAGRLVREKGFHILIKSISKSQFREKIILGIAGDGYFRNTLKLLSKKLNVQTKFFGLLENSSLVDYYCGADIFVTPSLWQEPFGIVNIEAMACECPVIATSTGGIPEIVEDRKTGFLYSPHDVNSLRNKIDFLIQNQQCAKKLGKNARKKVIKEYNWDILIKKWIALYKSL